MFDNNAVTAGCVNKQLYCSCTNSVVMKVKKSQVKFCCPPNISRASQQNSVAGIVYITEVVVLRQSLWKPQIQIWFEKTFTPIILSVWGRCMSSMGVEGVNNVFSNHFRIARFREILISRHDYNSNDVTSWSWQCVCVCVCVAVS